MAIPSTDNQDPLFLQDPPDWAEGVELEVKFGTAIHTARSGLEQRSRDRQYPKFRIAYQVSGLNATQFAQRNARAHLEVKLPVVVPIWSLQYGITGPASGQVVTLTQNARAEDGFREDEYVFIVTAAGDEEFLQVASFADDEVTLVGTIPTLTAAAVLYPCLVGFRSEGSTFLPGHLRSIDERIVIDGL